VAVSLDTFEGAAPAFWDGSSVSAGCTLDRTQTPPVAGWGTKCLHAVVDTNGDAAYLQSGSTIGGDAEWLSFDLCVNAHSIPNGTDLFIHFAFYDAGGPWEPVCAVAIYNDSGTLHLNTMAFYNGVENYGLLALPALTVGQRYRVAVKYDAAGSLFTVRLDGVDVITQAMAGAKKASVDHHQFGLVSNTHAGDDFSFNDFAFGFALGTAEDTLGALTSAAVGVHSITGTSARTLAAATSAGTGRFGFIGLGSTLLEALTSDGLGVVAGEVVGSADSYLSSASSTASGALYTPVTGTSARTLTSATSEARGTAAGGSAATTLAALTTAAQGNFRVSGTSAAALRDLDSFGFGTAYTARRVQQKRLSGTSTASRTLTATVR
jgi:hypothetical protein